MKLKVDLETITAPLCDNFTNAPKINWTHAIAVGAKKSSIMSCFVFISSLSLIHADREQTFGLITWFSLSGARKPMWSNEPEMERVQERRKRETYAHITALYFAQEHTHTHNQFYMSNSADSFVNCQWWMFCLVRFFLSKWNRFFLRRFFAESQGVHPAVFVVYFSFNSKCWYKT